MQVQGIIKVLEDTKEFGGNGFTKRLIVVTTQDEYPQQIPVEFIKDKCAILDNYKVGDAVKVDTNLNGREWISPQNEAKYFLSLTGWKIEKLDGATQSQTPPPAPAGNDLEEDENDLPF